MTHSLDLAEIGQLYRELAPQLERVLLKNLSVPNVVLEEACQRAWGQLVAHRQQVDRERALSWLATTARREAIRVMREATRDVSLEQELSLPAEPAADPERVVELRDRLAGMQSLPERQRRLLWLRGLGYDSAEIVQRTGESARMIERQLLIARRSLRERERGAAA